MYSASRSTPAHIAWLLPIGTLFFSCGIMLGRIALSWHPGAAILLLAGIAFLLGRQWPRAFAAAMMLLAAGTLLSWHAYHPDLPEEREYTVQATVAEAIQLREDGQVQTLLADVTLHGAAAPDAYWTFYLDEGETLPEWLVPGVQLSMTSTLYHPAGQSNPGGFNFMEYLLHRGISVGLYGADDLLRSDRGFSLAGQIAAIRHSLSQQLMEAMGEEAGSYAAAMLLGTRDFIPEDDRAAFNDLGIAHILSVSGYHVGVLVVLMQLLLLPLPIGRYGRIILQGTALTAYCFITGGKAPVIRAALLLIWREYTRLQNRQLLPLHMLCVTAMTQLIFNPTLLFSASFQLTYSAMLGLLLIHPWLKKQRAFHHRWDQKVWESFCAALAAQIGILFPQLYWFGHLPLASILLNMAIIPCFSALIALYWASLATLPIPGLRSLTGMLSAVSTSALLNAVRWLAAQDFADLWTRQADVITFAGWVLLIFGLSSFVPQRWKTRRRWIILVGMMLTVVILFPLPENQITYTQFSVGDADAAILQDRDMTVVIDAGEDGYAVAGYLHQRRQSVEMLIITHLHTDHSGGIRALIDEGIPVEVCCLPWAAETPIIDEELLPLLEELRLTGTEFRYLCRGDVIDLPTSQLTVLWPEAGRVFPEHDANDVNLVLQAEIAGVTMLLTGDLPGTHEQHVAVPADILKAGHHGSKGSNTADFVRTVNPQLILQSNRLKSRDYHLSGVAGDIPLYATEPQGGIVITFLGEGEFEVETVK